MAADFLGILCDGTSCSLSPAINHGQDIMLPMPLYRIIFLLGEIQNITNTAEDLTYLEDANELACSLADTYIELDDPANAESSVRAVINHQFPKQGALIIALAECLLAQKRLGEVEETLRRVFQCRLKLMKMDKLRLAIVQAKLSHLRSQFGEAFRYWTEAMCNLRRFNLASGRAYRPISLLDTLGKLLEAVMG